MKTPKWNKEHDFIERRFLNQGRFHSTAAIVSKIEKNEFNHYPYIDFNISDCSKVINLDLDIDTPEGLENSLFKLKQIKEVAENTAKQLEKIKPYLKKVDDFIKAN